MPGAALAGASQFLSRRRAKHQAPNPKLQRSSKSEAPNSKNRCWGKRRAGRFLSLELGASLELGVWNLELLAWALSLTRIEMPSAPVPLRINCCHHVDPNYTRQVRLNWKSLRLAIIPVFVLVLATGCSGINASGSVSPATFLLPGLGQARPEPVQPTSAVPASETAHLLAQSR